MHRSICIVLSLASLAAQAQSLQWQSAGDAQYVCGGVSEEGRAELNSQRAAANSELLFTEGPEGGYLADVSVTVRGAGLSQPLVFNANGPSCLLKLPNGNYVVEAEYKGEKRTQNLKAGNALNETKINWPELDN
ncbi:MAG TPA: hypothetical protein VFW00_12495 [Rhodocyclaceae bacterium]|nr:hypothetical protein [Rhodocyclaceae bacterium]